MTGGTFEMNMTDNGTMTIGYYGKGTLDISGDANFSSSCMLLGESATGDGTVNLSGNGTLNVSNGASFAAMALIIGESAGGTGVVNLGEGGTILVHRNNYKHSLEAGSGSGTFNFDGGTLKIGSANAFIKNNLATTVSAKGGTIDTQGYTFTVNREITGDGMLTLAGGGVVTFSASPACSVKIADGTSASISTLSIAAGKTLAGSGVVTDGLSMGAGAKLAVEVGAGGTVAPLTVGGAADLTGASVEFSGTENLVDVQDGAELVLLKADTIAGWEQTMVKVGGAKLRIAAKTLTDDETDATYQALTATKIASGLMLIFR